MDKKKKINDGNDQTDNKVLIDKEHLTQILANLLAAEKQIKQLSLLVVTSIGQINHLLYGDQKPRKKITDWKAAMKDW